MLHGLEAKRKLPGSLSIRAKVYRIPHCRE